MFPNIRWVAGVCTVLLLSGWPGALAPAAAQPTRVYVKADATGQNNGTSWTDAYRELRDALRSQYYPAEFWVAAGVYKPALVGDPNAAFELRNDQALYGGFAGTETELTERDVWANPTVLSGDLRGDDMPNWVGYGENSHSVVTAEYATATAVLDGFTVTAANQTGLRGGGPTVRNCTFLRNMGYQGGGAMVRLNGTVMFDHCAFVENRAETGGGMHIRRAATLRHCAFVRNEATGSGGGIYYYNDYSPIVVTFENCVFRGNTARDGGGAYFFQDYYDGGPWMRNCLITDNIVTGRGGGICGANYRPGKIYGCTIVGNSAVGGGGGIWGRAQVVGSIVWYNEGGNLQADPNQAFASFSDIEGGFTGEGNINSPPLFRDYPTGDYRLRSDSPCIDAGDPNYATLPQELDLAGHLRVWDGNGQGARRIDMGALEFAAPEPGDLNCDGLVNFGDINPFVLALSDPAAYAQQFPDCSIAVADINRDGRVDFGDINPLVELLSGGLGPALY